VSSSAEVLARWYDLRDTVGIGAAGDDLARALRRELEHIAQIRRHLEDWPADGSDVKVSGHRALRISEWLEEEDKRRRGRPPRRKNLEAYALEAGPTCSRDGCSAKALPGKALCAEHAGGPR